uniref:Pinhead n=1 Tax=Oncorhynchus kisutch TaxID=8019 RepID=A0A8C7L249_ONCKI
MDILLPYLLLILWALNVASASLLNKHVEHRNPFALRACCKRQSHFVYIGQDISGSPVSVDVGMCRTHCGGEQSRTSHEAGLQQGYSKHSSMLEYLRSKKVRVRKPTTPISAKGSSQVTSCGVNHNCEPTGVRVDQMLLFKGPREVEVIEECHCENKLTQCVRVPALKTYFFKTPYETVIDVGSCSGSKGSPDGFSCVPTKFDTALVKTPNKVDLVQTVEVCELSKSCYRVPYMEYYYEIVHDANGVKEEKLKEIDVGRCLGGCTTGNRCLLRSHSDSEVCYLWAERPTNSCVPRGYDSHMSLNQHGQIHTVLSISSCFCQS